MPTLDRAQLREELAAVRLSRRHQRSSELLSWTVEQMEHGVVHMNHPRYFGLFNPAAELSRRSALTASPDPSIPSWQAQAHRPRRWRSRRTSSVPWRSAPACRPSSGGHFTTSGSEANYTALVCALTRAEPRFDARRGARLLRSGGHVYLARVPAGVVQDRAPGRHRARCVAPRGHRRPRPHGCRGPGSHDRCRSGAGRGPGAGLARRPARPARA